MVPTGLLVVSDQLMRLESRQQAVHRTLMKAGFSTEFLKRSLRGFE
jgi:hypothetical protein